MDKTGAKQRILIAGNEGSTLLEYKILYLCMFEAAKGKYNLDGNLFLRIRAAELMEKMNLTGGSAYRRIGDAAKSLEGRRFRIKHDNIKNVNYINAVLGAEYNDGILNLLLNHKAFKAINGTFSDMDENFLKIMMKWESVYSFSLFEFLNDECIYENSKKDTEIICRFNIMELYRCLGIRIFSDTKPSIAWADFNRKIFTKAIDEINMKSNMRIEYELERAGRGGKIQQVKLVLSLIPKREDISETDHMQLVREEVERLGLPKRDAIKLFMAADGDYYRLKSEISKLLKSTGVTSEFTALLVEQLQN